MHKSTDRRRRAWLGLGCLVALEALHAAQNLVRNSSFEEGLAAWALWHEDGAAAEARLAREEPRHGPTAITVRSANGRAVLHSEPIPVRGDTDFTLSAYARTRGATEAALAVWVSAEEAALDRSWSPDAADRGGNVLANPAFENGPQGWQLWHADPAVSSGGVGPGGRAGGQAFRVVNPGSEGANLHSDPVPCQAGTAYRLAVYAKVRAGNGVGIALWARDAAGKTLSYAVERTLELPAEVPEFRRFALTVTAPPESAELKAHLVNNGGEVWWDDCQLSPLSADVGYEVRSYLDLPAEQPAWARFKHIVHTPPACRSMRVLLLSGGEEVTWDAVQVEAGRDATPYSHVLSPADANLLPNSGFEDGSQGWTLWRQAPDQSAGGVEADCGRGGGRAFLVRSRAPGGANLYSDPVPCRPGTTVTLSAFARVVGGQGVQVALWGIDGDGKTLAYEIEGHTALPADVPRYTRFAKTVLLPERTVGLKAHLVCNGGEVWWDDVQLEAAPTASPYVPGPRYEVLRPSWGPATVEYTQAIIREARLRDVLAQTERLADYAVDAQRAVLADGLAAARQAVDAVTRAVGASFLVPPYRTLDHTALDQLADSAGEQLMALWRELGHDPATVFAPWAPGPLPANVDRDQLAREFLIFPCFTRPDFLRGEGNWEVLAPFRFRLVSGWWGLGCYAAGNLRADEMAAVLALCRQHGYPCDIALDPAQAVASALGSGEEYFLHNAEGGWSPVGNCHNTVSIWHPEVRRLGARFAERVAARFAAEAAVVAYEMTNEPSLTIEQHQHGYDYRPAGVGGYEPAAVSAWRAWLQTKHGSLAELNRRWRTAHASFAEITPPADLRPPSPATGSQPVPTGPLHDFQAFRAESHAEWFRLCLEAFRRGDPRKAVVSQFYSPAIERKDAAVDLRSLAEDVPWGFYGTHDWPGGRPAVESLYAVAMNRRARLPHWEDEFIWSQWERKGTAEPVMRAALERNLWRQIAWGKRGISLFNLESEWAHDSPQNWNNSLLNLEADLEVPRYCTGILPTIERKVHGFREILYATELGPVAVAILRPTASTLVAIPDGRVRQEAVAVAEALLRRHELPLLVPEEHLADNTAALAGVRLLVAPWAVHVPVAVQEQLLAWVREGGVLACSGPFGLFDEYGTPAGLVLRAGFGEPDWRYDQTNQRWQGRGVAAGAGGFATAACGRGRMVLSLEPFASPARLEALAALQASLIPIPLIETTVPDLEVLPRQNAASEQFLFVTNLNAREARQGDIRVRGRFAAVTELSGDARPQVPARPMGAATVLPIRLAPGGAVFLRLGRPE
jgi:hypothetical protein